MSNGKGSNDKDKNKGYEIVEPSQKITPRRLTAKTPKNKIKKPKRFILQKFKLSVSIGGYSAGCVIKIPCHRKTLVPKDRYWRMRLRDAKVDNCMVPYTEENIK